MVDGSQPPQWVARCRALVVTFLVLALGACGDTDAFNPESSVTPETADAADGTVTLAEMPAMGSASFSGGIPFGTFAQPTSAFGSIFNGAHRTIYPQYLLKELAAIKARGGKVAIKLSYGDRYIKDAQGNFSLSKWKSMVDRYKGVNFGSYINDGTIIGHYLIDEPQDVRNWNGKAIPQATIEEMAKHSKMRWPSMTTIVRTWPDYLDDYKGSYRYLDAAWAQYAANRWPDAKKFVEDNVAKAKAKGLALVVGLNVIDGSPTKGNMSASQVRAYGSALLSSTYPCAFLSWQYRDKYMTASIKDAMSELRRKAQSRSTKSCKA